MTIWLVPLLAVLAGIAIGWLIARRLYRFQREDALRLAAHLRSALDQAKVELANRPHPAAALIAWADTARARGLTIEASVRKESEVKFCGNIPILSQREIPVWTVQASEASANRTLSAHSKGDLSTACETVLKELRA